MQNSIRNILIPAAGFGRRVGSPPAKELFPDPETGKPLIEFSIDIAESNDAQAVVITRKDKLNLIEELKNYPVNTFLIESSREWPDTILKSKPCWKEYNIVILPDTRFKPISIVASLFKELEAGANIVFATFKVEGFNTWGVLASNQENCYIAEKPSNEAALKFQEARAWGIFGFKKDFGESLLQAMIESGVDHQFREINPKISELKLEMFKDLTRWL